MATANVTSVASRTNPFARPRPRRGWLDAVTTLENFALVTFDVDPATLAATLPPTLTPEVRTDGEPCTSSRRR